MNIYNLVKSLGSNYEDIFQALIFVRLNRMSEILTKHENFSLSKYYQT